MVQRYDPGFYDGMTKADDGDYVEYEDYKKLVEACDHAYSFMICVANLDNEENLKWQEDITKELKQVLKESENPK